MTDVHIVHRSIISFQPSFQIGGDSVGIEECVLRFILTVALSALVSWAVAEIVWYFNRNR